MEALRNTDLSKVLVLDIETVSAQRDFASLDSEWQHLWSLKARNVAKEQTPEEAYERAGIYSEFARVICISVGIFQPYNQHYRFRVTSFYGHDEHDVLQRFADLLHRRFHGKDFILCAHNGKEFDFPFLARRMTIQGIRLPLLLDMGGKKPWEIQHLDTMELWKFGDFKNYTSLALLAKALSIPTPKDDIDGSQVGRVYYEEQNLERIKTYCQKDVFTVAQILLRMRGEPCIPAEDVFEV
ncbi:MAG: 3'-5' exonuclease [Bacteroidetes bacterium]|nr:3'-5' exonuclease [Bacteroidota bacterium]